MTKALRLALALALLGPAAAAAAEENPQLERPPGRESAEVRGQEAAPTDRVLDQIEELERAVLARDQVIRSLLERVEALEARLADPDEAREEQLVEAPVPPADEGRRRAEAAVAAAEEGERREQQQLVRAAFEQTLIDRGGLLLPPRTLEVESGLSYIGSSSDQIIVDGFTILPVLVVGDIVNERVRSEIVQATATARLGLPYDLQIETRIPYGYQHRETVTAENEEASLEDTSLGDIEIALSHQLLRGRGRWPDILGSLRYKSTTGDDPFSEEATDRASLGSGFESWSTSLTAVHVTDPVVFYGGLSYTYNEPVSTDSGRFVSGDTWGGQIGMAIALNLDTSISFGFDQQFTTSSSLDGDHVPGSSLVTGTFVVGASYSATPDVTLDFSVRVGVTEDSPDIQVNLGVPVRLRF